jgi:cytochrome P450
VKFYNGASWISGYLNLERIQLQLTYHQQTVISAQPYTIHRYEGVFEDPDEFRPERWLNIPSNKKDRMYRAFIPFSAGQRG